MATARSTSIRTGYLFVLPALLLLLAVLGFPALWSLGLSFRAEGRDGFSLEQYRLLLEDSLFHQTFWNTGLLVGLSVAAHLGLGLAVALPLNLPLRGQATLRLVALLPWVVPDVVAGIIWKWLYNPLNGALNDVLVRLGLLTTPLDWLGAGHLPLVSVILANVWRGFPFVMLILLAGLQAIPRERYEAASIDGANALQRFRHITLPGLRKMLVVSLALDTVWEVRRFGLIQAMTQGGPGNLTEVLSTLVYKQYFAFFRFEYASAIAVVMAAVLLIVSLPYIRMISQEE
ncbi:MAG: sugar ABC transporter permease [Candidatus Rokubacteria bacterium]|nr:sugar ABC transporter permease [Candidatus Rokubacteria bacterium]